MKDYATLRDAPDGSLQSIETLRAALVRATAGTVGVIITGTPSADVFLGGEWGPAVHLQKSQRQEKPCNGTQRSQTGETLQLRIHPRDAWVTTPRQGEIRAVAVRTLGLQSGLAHHTAVLLCICSDDDGAPDEEGTPSVADVAATAGCGFLHLLPPALLSRWHGTTEDVRSMEHDHSASLWSYEAVSPSAVTYVTEEKRELVVTTGRVSTFLAARLLGMQVPNVLESPAPYMKESDYRLSTLSLYERVDAGVGVTRRLHGTRVACRLLETLDAEAVLAMRSCQFLRDALPSSVHEPGGMPLLIVAACRLCKTADVSIRGRRLVSTPRDALLNDDLALCFEEGWTPLLVTDDGPVYAIDVIIQNALMNTKAHAMANGSKEDDTILLETLYYWIHVGQRLVASVMSAPSTLGKQATASEDVEDLLGPSPLMKEKRRQVEASGAGGRLHERRGLLPLSRSRGREVLLRLHNEVEQWLRTGTYAGVATHDHVVSVHDMIGESGEGQERKSKPSGPTPEPALPSSPFTSSPDTLSRDAVECAQTVLLAALIGGPTAVAYSLDLSTFLATETEKSVCPSCGGSNGCVDALLCTAGASCRVCCRAICVSCRSEGAICAACVKQNCKGR